jgi:hypothetical protein
MIKFLEGVLTTLFLVGIYLNLVTIPEFIIQYECIPSDTQHKKSQTSLSGFKLSSSLLYTVNSTAIKTNKRKDQSSVNLGL